MSNGDTDLEGFLSGYGNGDGGKLPTLRPGEFLQDSEGGWWRVYDIGGHKLRLAPVAGLGSQMPTAPKSQWRLPTGTYQNELGELVQVDTQGSITGSRTIPWSDWAGGGDGGARAAPAWSSTQAAAEFGAAEAEKERTWESKEARDLEAIRAQNDLRARLMGEVSALYQAAEGIRQRDRESLGLLEERAWEVMGETLGQDVVRGAALSTGQVARGTTPMEAYRTRVGGVGREAGQLREGLAGQTPQPNLSADVEGLRDVLRQVTQARAGDDRRPVLSGVSVGIADGVMTAEASDGCWLMRVTLDVTEEFDAEPVIWSGETVKAIVAALTAALKVPAAVTASLAQKIIEVVEEVRIPLADSPGERLISQRFEKSDSCVFIFGCIDPNLRFVINKGIRDAICNL